MRMQQVFRVCNSCRHILQRKLIQPLPQVSQALSYTTEPTRYTVSYEDFKYVQDMLPPSRIPEPPTHGSYPTPSGWVAPSEKAPDLPYFISRTKFHVLPIVEKEKPRDQPVTVVFYIDGDIWALEKELKELIRPYVEFDPATRVHEVTRSITLKGHHAEVIEKFLYAKGF
uniref:Large ribosomal subunit protein mL49 n=1 Tax=Ciona intestinalis TaxID=7719 RepID=F6VD64_CIOIN|nr:39S ribosomal protein L49, mitochondrial-like [Ciona intestinalis]|eukprot:XP_002126528.1 39S ribosomal protein L49, mitochondrial-like [Ciona intestinalis]